MYEQVAFATLLDGGEVKTGHEKQVVMVRMSVMNTDPTESQQATWWAYVPGDRRDHIGWTAHIAVWRLHPVRGGGFVAGGAGGGIAGGA